MTTPAGAAPAKAAAPAPPAPDPRDIAIAAIARHITGRPADDSHGALVALGLTTGQAKAITGT